MQGKETDDNGSLIPRHPISSIKACQDYANSGMPNSLQLFCLGFGIIKKKLAVSHEEKTEQFVKAWIAERFNTLRDDSSVIAFFDNRSHADAGLMLNGKKDSSLFENWLTL